MQRCLRTQFFCWDSFADFADLDGLFCYFDLIQELNTGALTGRTLPSACIHQALETFSAIILCHWCSFIARLTFGKLSFLYYECHKNKGCLLVNSYFDPQAPNIICY
jgi:hypothetical protein